MIKRSAVIEPWPPGSNHDDGLETLLQIETILPDQYWGVPAPDERTEPARRLLFAVLEDALITLVQHAGRTGIASQRLVAEIRSWVASDRHHTPFDFAPLCDILGIEIGYVRALVQRLQRRSMPAPMRRRGHAGRGHHKVRTATRRRRPPQRA